MHTTRYRVAATLRASTPIPHVEDSTGKYTDSWLGTFILAVEEYVRSFGEPFLVTTASQQAFDAACLEVFTRRVASPSLADNMTSGDTNVIYKTSPALFNWINRFATTGGQTGAVVGSMTRGCC